MTPAPTQSSSRVARAIMAAPAVLLLVVTGAAQVSGGLRGGDERRGDAGGGGAGHVIAPISLEHHHGGHHGRGGKSRPRAPAEKEEGNGFDFYVFSMSHQPEFCRENGERFAGCHAPREEWQGQLTIHGLWPNRNDGTWPSDCTDDKFDVALLTDLAEDLSHRWPNIKAMSPGAKGHTSFWEHEWIKHGTCSGLGQKDYFATALDLLLMTPDIVREKYGATVTREELAADPFLGGDMSIFACRSGYLSEVRVCYERTADGSVGERVSCPGSVLEEDSCGEDIRIAAFAAGATAVE